jgi:FAD-dependent urate hydroxylase
MSRCDVAIVGAGPYGLSVAAHLRAGRTTYRIFGLPMDSWRRHMPAGMFLKSEGFASSVSDPAGSLTLRRFCEESGHTYADIGEPVPIETFRAYGDWFRDRAGLEVEEVEVVRVERGNGDFGLQLGSGDTLTAGRVVIATGLTHFAHVPQALRGLPPSLLTHTYDHSSFETFRGRTVAVVGAGQSALETAVLLDESGASPNVVSRARMLRWNPVPVGENGHFPPMTGLGRSWKLWAYSTFTPAYRWLPDETRVRIARTTLGPAGAWWLRPRLRTEVPVFTGAVVTGVEQSDGGVRLTLAAPQRTELEVEHVVAGTGYRVDVDRLGALEPGLRAQLRRVHGAPHLSRHFESSVPGLYFVGIAAANTFGPAMRFVCGTEIAAPRVAAHAARN